MFPLHKIGENIEIGMPPDMAQENLYENKSVVRCAQPVFRDASYAMGIVVKAPCYDTIAAAADAQIEVGVPGTP